MGILQFENIHHALEGKLVEIKAVAHIIVRRHGFRIIVYHDTAVALLADGVQSLHATPVELYGRTDTVGAGAQYDDALLVAQIMNVVGNTAIRQVQIVGLCGIFGGKSINLLYYGQDACMLTIVANVQDAVFHVSFEADGTGNLEIGKALHFCLAQQAHGDC